MEQQVLVKPSEEEIAKLKSRVSGLLAEYIAIEEERTEANRDFGERMKDLWDEIKGIQIRIKEAERA